MTKVSTSIRMVRAAVVSGGRLWCPVGVWIYRPLWWCLCRRSTEEPLDQTTRPINTASEVDHRTTIPALGLEEEQNQSPCASV